MMLSEVFSKPERIARSPAKKDNSEAERVLSQGKDKTGKKSSSFAELISKTTIIKSEKSLVEKANEGDLEAMLEYASSNMKMEDQAHVNTAIHFYTRALNEHNSVDAADELINIYEFGVKGEKGEFIVAPDEKKAALYSKKLAKFEEKTGKKDDSSHLDVFEFTL